MMRVAGYINLGTARLLQSKIFRGYDTALIITSTTACPLPVSAPLRTLHAPQDAPWGLNVLSVR